MKLTRLFCLLAVLSIGVTHPAQGRDIAQEIQSVRSFTYYDGSGDASSKWREFDLGKFSADLDGMKAVGANTVWLVLPWYNFQPVALPQPVWDNKAVQKLNDAVGLAENKGMRVILPLCYLGPSWSPEGIDAHVWVLDKTMYEAFSTYALELIGKLAAHKNIMYFLYTEGSEPTISILRKNKLTIDGFREWARKRNPDIAYWNKRWEANFTWETMLPLPSDNSFPPGASQKAIEAYWTDHWRWCGSLMVERHGELARKIKALVKDNALLGYHEYSLINRDWGKGESPIPKENPYDFLSFVHYTDLKEYPVETTLKDMAEKVARFRKRYPQMPLMLGESGANTYEMGFRDQAKVAKMVLDFAAKEKIGVNWWMWQDFICPDLIQSSFGLLTPAGKQKPVYDVFKKAWTEK